MASMGPSSTALRTAVHKAGAVLEVVAPKIGGVKTGRQTIVPDHQLAGGPSVLFDAVVVAASADGAAALAREAAAIDWLRDAYGHLKAIGITASASQLLQRAGLEADEGVITLDAPATLAAFITAAEQGRFWEREPRVRS